MAMGWEYLPLLPLRNILDHLSLKDAVATMSVCRNWRTAAMVYEYQKELVQLKTQSIDKNMFLTRLYKKHVRRLHIHVNSSGEQLDEFFNNVLPEFFDSVKLNEIIFFGPSYLKQNHALPPAKIKRIATESLLLKLTHCKKFALLGCELDEASDDDRYVNEQIEYYAEPLSFPSPSGAADRVLSRANTSHMHFSTLQHIIVDYDQIGTEALETLSHLPMFSLLSLNITAKWQRFQPTIDWERIASLCPNTLNVAVNIISLPPQRLSALTEEVLVEELPLVSLKVLFCKTVSTPFLVHVVGLYKHSLREVVWVDSPLHAVEQQRIIFQPPMLDTRNLNPFILLCWQSVHLKRLVIHGYWMWNYDVLGFVRLRKTIQHLEVSAVYEHQKRFNGGRELPAESMIRVMGVDSPKKIDEGFVEQVNLFADHPWSPTPWSQLHPALRARATPAHRAHYIQHELTNTMDLMSKENQE